jgi:heat shock protein HslJ
MSFQKTMQTEMFCENNMVLENTFSGSISDTFTFKTERQLLILTNSKNERMVFVAQDWD